MKTKITILAQGAYFSASEGVRSSDCLLPPGKGWEAGARQMLAEMREDIHRREGRADFLERAIEHHACESKQERT